ncbi:MAG: hypothetical protein WB987_11550 [Candidatus Acidiferrales bacterium]
MTTQSKLQPNSNSAKNGKARFKLSLDTWAVALSLALSLLVWLGLLKHIPW